MNIPYTDVNLDPYLSFDFIIRNEVIIPSVVIFILGWITLKYQQRAENDENFITLKFKFTELWAGIAIDDEVLSKDYKDLNKKQRFKIYALIEFFSVVWFLHIKKRTSYSNEWDHNTRHVFKYKVIQTAFNHIILENKLSFNENLIKYLKKVIDESQNT